VAILYRTDRMRNCFPVESSSDPISPEHGTYPVPSTVAPVTIIESMWFCLWLYDRAVPIAEWGFKIAVQLKVRLPIWHRWINLVGPVPFTLPILIAEVEWFPETVKLPFWIKSPCRVAEDVLQPRVIPDEPVIFPVSL
jgi:hypothetical protein